MYDNKIVNIENIEGISMEVPAESRKELLQLIYNAATLASGFIIVEPTFRAKTNLPQIVNFRLGASYATQAVSAILAAASVKCHLAAPPEDIEMKLDSSGRLIYRCYHSPAHKWNLDGSPIP
jgi:hypothetical protein